MVGRKRDRNPKKALPKSFEENWDFLLRNSEVFGSMIPAKIAEPSYDEDGLDAKNCFYLFDSTGKLHPCSDVKTFVDVLATKKGVNLHIKMWVDSYIDMIEPISYYMQSFKGPVPNWVGKAFSRSLKKAGIRDVNHIGVFVRMYQERRKLKLMELTND